MPTRKAALSAPISFSENAETRKAKSLSFHIISGEVGDALGWVTWRKRRVIAENWPLELKKNCRLRQKLGETVKASQPNRKNTHVRRRGVSYISGKHLKYERKARKKHSSKIIAVRQEGIRVSVYREYL